MKPGSEAIRVLIVDDHALYRRGLQTVLAVEEGIEVVAEASDGVQAVERAEALRPDVVLMDVGMPRSSGVQACSVVKDRVPTARVIMLTGSDDPGHLLAAARAGAHGYLLKDATEEIALGIRSVAGGYSLLSPAMTDRLLMADAGRAHGVRTAANGGLPPLTRRQLQVLQRIAGGHTNRQIAAELSISEFTVRQHVRNILDRLQMHSKIDAATYALRRGLIEAMDT